MKKLLIILVPLLLILGCGSYISDADFSKVLDNSYNNGNATGYNAGYTEGYRVGSNELKTVTEKLWDAQASIEPAKENSYSLGYDDGYTQAKDDVLTNLEQFSSYEFYHQYGLKPSDFYYSQRHDIDTNWTANGYTNVAGKWLMAYSKKAWSYPALAFECIWPTLGSPNLCALVKLEEGPRGRLSRHGLDMITNHFSISAGAGDQRVRIDIENLLPADYNTATHLYGLKLNKCNLEAFIDDKLAGVVLMGLPEPIPVWENCLPYAVGSSASTLLAMKSLIGIHLEPTGAMPSYTLGIRWGIDQVVCNDGDPLPPRQYVLYSENTATKWNGITTSTTVTSHPLPIWGYKNKTLHLQSNASGVVDVQIYVGGGWRTLTNLNLVANELTTYSITIDAPIARCVYVPIGTDTITVAELYLS